MTAKEGPKFTEDQWIQIYRAVCDKADFLDLPIETGLEVPTQFDPEGAPWQLREIAKTIFDFFNPGGKESETQGSPRSR